MGAPLGIEHVVSEALDGPTRLCFECGHKNDTLTLSDRTWACSTCGCVLDRDLNAARNIKREGLRILAAGHADNSHACGVGVRPPITATDGEARILAL